MKNQIKAAIVSLLVVGSAHAITLTDNNPADTLLIAGGPFASYTGTFTLSPYDPFNQQVNSASTTFTLWDAILNETWNITLGGTTVHSGTSFIGEITLGPSGVAGTALMTLSNTGTLSYTVTANTGSFWLTNAFLTAEVGARAPGNASGVPDHGSSVLMLVGGLLALGALRRGRFVA